MGKGGKKVVVDPKESSLLHDDDNNNNKDNNNDAASAAMAKVAPAPTKFSKEDFIWSATDEPHAKRRKLILAKYPEIKQLYGHCPMLKYKVLFAVGLQFSLAYYFRHAGTTTSLAFWLTAYIVGGTCNHMLMMALHELSHNLGFKKMQHNRWFSVFVANLPIGVPAAVTFKRYHMDHHKYQGVDGMDVDIPTAIEGKIFNNPFTKFFFVLFQMAFYALRPMVVNPKDPGWPEAINWATVLTVDAAVVYFWGINSMLYFLASTWLGMGMHPVAGHFIAEHFVFNDTDKDSFGEPLETYSYYGMCNIFTLNVGYHNEHHDFPFVPGSRLPKLNSIASEFYQDLPHHTSYCKVLFDFIFKKDVTAFNRVKRNEQITDFDDSTATKKEQ